MGGMVVEDARQARALSPRAQETGNSEARPAARDFRLTEPEAPDVSPQARGDLQALNSSRCCALTSLSRSSSRGRKRIAPSRLEAEGFGKAIYPNEPRKVGSRLVKMWALHPSDPSYRNKRVK